MRRTMNIMSLAEASAKAARRAKRGRTLSARSKKLLSDYKLPSRLGGVLIPR